MDTESLLSSDVAAPKRRYVDGNQCLKFLVIFGLACGTITLYVYTTYTVNNRLGEYVFSTFSGTAVDVRWTWSCQKDVCARQPHTSGARISLETCNMLCGNPQIWPMPSRINENTKQASSFFTQQLYLQLTAEGPIKSVLIGAFDIFVQNVEKLIKSPKPWYQRSSVDHFAISIFVNDPDSLKLTLNTDESYNLTVELWDRDIRVNVSAATWFGARHGLETLSQLIWWDQFEDDGMLKILHDVDIHDRPSFPYRGVMVDTARNYFSLGALKKVLEGMAANKLNAFHWHLTDAQSFPLYSSNTKHLAEDGAYGADMVYTSDDVKDLIGFAKARGIRVIIEIDAPAHTLSGWEWGPLVNMSDLIVKSTNGMSGQLNPDNPFVLEILRGVYADVLDLMGDDEIFHAGGDEVDLKLWKDLEKAKNYTDLNDLWADFLNDMFDALKTANNGVSPRNIVVWSNKLTENAKLKRYLNVSNTVIQYWYGNSQQFMTDRYRVILSKVDHWYLDCGFGAWREGVSPNCDPFRTWQTFYKAVPWVGFDLELVLGGEVCLWTEQVEENSLETRIWPRTAAYAERIWSNPSRRGPISTDVYTRLDSQRRRLIGRGVKSAVLWPRWCTENPGKC